MTTCWYGTLRSTYSERNFGKANNDGKKVVESGSMKMLKEWRVLADGDSRDGLAGRCVDNTDALSGLVINRCKMWIVVDVRMTKEVYD